MHKNQSSCISIQHDSHQVADKSRPNRVAPSRHFFSLSWPVFLRPLLSRIFTKKAEYRTAGSLKSDPQPRKGTKPTYIRWPSVSAGKGKIGYDEIKGHPYRLPTAFNSIYLPHLQTSNII